MARILLVLPMLWLGLLGRSQNVDIRLLQHIHTPHYTQSDDAFRWVTNTTTFVSLGIPAGMLAIGWLKNDSTTLHNALVITASYAITGAISLSLKYATNRPRPFDAYPQLFQKKTDGGSPSFPSGHSSLAFATATSLSLQYPRWYIIVPSYLWAGTVAYSRMHLGVHYPSDVLMGAFIGSASAYLSYKANLWLHKKYKK